MSMVSSPSPVKTGPSQVPARLGRREGARGGRQSYWVATVSESDLGLWLGAVTPLAALGGW
jgi:hypothetical protein